jgi:hypothetical protein
MEDQNHKADVAVPTGTAESLTLARLRETMDELKHLMPPRDSGMSLFGMPVFIAPEFPKVRLNYKVRTKYGDEFELLTKEQQAETDAWLLATFGTTSAIPENTAYVFGSMFGQGIHFNPRDAVKLHGFI